MAEDRPPHGDNGLPSDPEALRARILELERENHELRRLEEALRQSERELNRAQHLAHIGSWTWNIRTDHFIWSDEMYRLSGIEKVGFSDVSADAVEAAVHPDDREMVTAANRAVANGADPEPLEYRVIWPDGSVHIIASEAGELMLDEGGRPTILWGTAQDVTERKRAEEVQRDRERWLNESQRVARLGHFVYDIEHDHWSVAPTLYEVLGIGEGYDRGLSGWLGIMHPAERERMSRHFTREALVGGQRLDAEYRIVRPLDGAERWVHSLGSLECDDSGLPTALYGTIQDITGRKLTENALNRERALLAQAESIGHIGSWRVRIRGGESRWSDEAVRIVGRPPVPGGDGFEGLREAVIPEHRGTFEEWLLSASSSLEPCRADFRIARPDGEERWVCAHGAREVDGEDGDAFVAGILHDVTEVKRIEEERVGVLEQAANVDRLTGLHNVRGFELLAEQAIAQARRNGQGVGLIFCDLDGLKSINDEFGHAQGDRALLDVASVLTYTLRSADAIARIGGDEFLVLAVGADRSAIVRLDERLKEGFEFFNATTTRPYRISLSSGVAWSEPGEVSELDELKAVADRAMYEDKLRDGRSTE